MAKSGDARMGTEGAGHACVLPEGARRSPLESALPDDLLCAVLRHVINYKFGFRCLGTLQGVNKLWRNLVMEDESMGRMAGEWLWSDKEFVSMKWGAYVHSEMVPIPQFHQKSSIDR